MTPTTFGASAHACLLAADGAGADITSLTYWPLGDVVREKVLGCLYRSGMGPDPFATYSTMTLPWAQVYDWLQRPAMKNPSDQRALLSMCRGMALEWDVIVEWASMGHLEAGMRLSLSGIAPELARSFLLGNITVLDMGVVRMVGAARAAGIHPDDLRWWIASGLVAHSQPYLRDGFAAWRNAGATRIGMTRAGIAAAAGLTPEQAIRMVEDEQFDIDAMRMMAALLTGETL